MREDLVVIDGDDTVGHYLVRVYDALEHVEEAVESVRSPDSRPDSVRDASGLLSTLAERAEQLGFSRLNVVSRLLYSLLERVAEAPLEFRPQLIKVLAGQMTCIRQILASIAETGREPGLDIGPRRPGPRYIAPANAFEDTEPALQLGRALSEILDGLR